RARRAARLDRAEPLGRRHRAALPVESDLARSPGPGPAHAPVPRKGNHRDTETLSGTRRTSAGYAGRSSRAGRRIAAARDALWSAACAPDLLCASVVFSVESIAA